MCAAEEIWGPLFMTHNGRVTSPLDSLDVHQSCGNIQNVSQRPSSSPPYSAGTVHLCQRCSRMVLWPSRPDHRFPSRPSSRGVQARSNLQASEWRGSGLWTCGRSGNGCRSLHASANPWLSRSQWRCSGHRRSSAGLSHRISFSTLSQYCCAIYYISVQRYQYQKYFCRY